MPAPEAVDLSDLPDVLARFAEAAGVGPALKLAAAFGGTELYIPEKMVPGHRIAEAVGREPAEILVEIFGTGVLLIPLGPTSMKNRTHDEIRRLRSEGRAYPDIARATGVHIRTVQRVCNAAKDDPRQLDLLNPA